MDSDRLLIVLDRVRLLLEEHDVAYATVVAEWVRLYPQTPSAVNKDVRKRFSGMGGLNDIVICKDNGHKIGDKEDEKEATFELRALLNVLWEEIERLGGQASTEKIHLKGIPDTREAIDAVFVGDNLEAIYNVLVWTTYYFSDSSLIERGCASLTFHPNSGVRRLAISCWADLFRLKRAQEKRAALDRLTELLRDSRVRDRAEKMMGLIKGDKN
jgi:hypothetical protein